MTLVLPADSVVPPPDPEPDIQEDSKGAALQWVVAVGAEYCEYVFRKYSPTFGTKRGNLRGLSLEAADPVVRFAKLE